MSRVPLDKPLALYIKLLIQRNELYLFYFTEDWKRLREDVLRDNHYQCAECKKKGRYTRAECVHHVREVKYFPQLALSRTYIDDEGNECDNLIPLCNSCHNVVHGRFQNRPKFSNVERW